MGSMKDTLGDTPFSGYPATPGFKERTTSREAALAVAPLAGNLRVRVLGVIVNAGARGLTPDEAAEVLGETVLAVRPRFTELAHGAAPRIEKTGKRRPNASGLKANAWRSRTCGP